MWRRCRISLIPHPNQNRRPCCHAHACGPHPQHASRLDLDIDPSRLKFKSLATNYNAITSCKLPSLNVVTLLWTTETIGETPVRHESPFFLLRRADAAFPSYIFNDFKLHLFSKGYYLKIFLFANFQLALK